MDVAEQRLIDANVLADRLQKLETDIYAEAAREKDPVKACISGIVEGIKKQVIAAPIVDAAPVVHAEWEHNGGDEWRCTACCLIISTEGSWENPWQRYCPSCGAKMDGGAT